MNKLKYENFIKAFCIKSSISTHHQTGGFVMNIFQFKFNIYLKYIVDL